MVQCIAADLLAADAKHKLDGANGISPIVEINGVDAVYFLESQVALGIDMHDPDARYDIASCAARAHYADQCTRYNAIFPSASAKLSNNSYSGGAWTRHKGLWPGAAVHDLRFANDSHVIVQTSASWPEAHGPMQYRTGEDLFQAACVKNQKSAIGHRMPIYGDSASAAQNYPEPVLRQESGPIRGHYINATDFMDVAILQVPSFQVWHAPRAFTNAVDSFLRLAAAAGKTKLIIDISDNNGGDVAAGLSLYQQLLPDLSFPLQPDSVPQT